MATLWRLDGQHSKGDGALTMLRRARHDAKLLQDQLIASGWLTTLEKVEFGPIADWQLDVLCQRIWPVISEARLVVWAAQSRLKINELTLVAFDPEEKISLGDHV